ncbi:MAG: hypothetical protein J7623_13150 [Chitinophaga sp.]|uniref:HYC_CC_PP family protein n=1 Tax=Chitinophaga sp. TaxID=1869181 RepID=UPI001B0EE73C|nr:hypothetical protein [Chitinophaga sp.]MBO9729578.1 hypothetical protein [Chitinophaga sp.]
MKKLLALILAVLYVSTSTGATFHMHYCMGKLIDAGWRDSEVKKCSQCTRPALNKCSKKCCKDEHKTVKLEKDQKLAENTVHAMQGIAVITPVSFMDAAPAYILSLTTLHPVTHAPPRSSKVPVHVMNCTYRI